VFEREEGLLLAKIKQVKIKLADRRWQRDRARPQRRLE